MTGENRWRYNDIIDLPHHTSPTRPRMPMENRAAQFSPFQALSGYGAAIKETARLTDERIDLDEDSKMLLNEKIRIIAERFSEQPRVAITYFQPDKRKTGGAYISATGQIKRIDEYQRTVILTDRTAIPIDQIYEIESDLFPKLPL